MQGEGGVVIFLPRTLCCEGQDISPCNQLSPCAVCVCGGGPIISQATCQVLYEQGLLRRGEVVGGCWQWRRGLGVLLISAESSTTLPQLVPTGRVATLGPDPAAAH